MLLGRTKMLVRCLSCIPLFFVIFFFIHNMSFDLFCDLLFRFKKLMIWQKMTCFASRALSLFLFGFAYKIHQIFSSHCISLLPSFLELDDCSIQIELAIKFSLSERLECDLNFLSLSKQIAYRKWFDVFFSSIQFHLRSRLTHSLPLFAPFNTIPLIFEFDSFKNTTFQFKSCFVKFKFLFSNYY